MESPVRGGNASTCTARAHERPGRTPPRHSPGEYRHGPGTLAGAPQAARAVAAAVRIDCPDDFQGGQRLFPASDYGHSAHRPRLRLGNPPASPTRSTHSNFSATAPWTDPIG